jgi:uncharacterized membrane protein YkoI
VASVPDVHDRCMTDNSSHPDHTPDTTPIADSSPVAPSDRADGSRRSRTRTLLIAGGSVLAAAVLAGGGIAVGAAIADEMDDDDDRDSANVASDDDGTESASAPSADRGTDSAAELADIITAASASADGNAVGVEAGTDGTWDVQFETTAGDETEVRVTADGSTKVVSTEAADADESAALGVLDADTVDALVAAAMAEVEGRIVDIEIDDDTASPFDVSVVQANGRTVAVELDADLTVVSINPA